jgi:hypothetical protein
VFSSGETAPGDDAVSTALSTTPLFSEEHDIHTAAANVIHAVTRITVVLFMATLISFF